MGRGRGKVNRSISAIFKELILLLLNYNPNIFFYWFVLHYNYYLFIYF